MAVLMPSMVRSRRQTWSRVREESTCAWISQIQGDSRYVDTLTLPCSSLGSSGLVWVGLAGGGAGVRPGCS